MNITVFGGANPQPGEPAYQEAYELGRLLALQGHTVLTGGYIGTMEAVSRGAAEAGGHVIGVTCTPIELWRKVSANAWVKEEWRCQTLTQRLDRLIEGSQAWIALPGGVGTLAEISLAWNQMIIQALPVRPLILVGTGWQSVIELMFASFDGYIKDHDKQLVQAVPDIQTAASLLKSPSSS
ncbi:MAG TPA: LOG family protein [Anaerolineaceae bacterium]|nr:LOG family protein [Anaerolineaceae bacterium]HPN51630.1 LOG family protein [Anaerolineaceae bacterium]